MLFPSIFLQNSTAAQNLTWNFVAKFIYWHHWVWVRLPNLGQAQFGLMKCCTILLYKLIIRVQAPGSAHPYRSSQAQATLDLLSVTLCVEIVQIEHLWN